MVAHNGCGFFRRRDWVPACAGMTGGALRLTGVPLGALFTLTLSPLPSREMGCHTPHRPSGFPPARE